MTGQSVGSDASRLSCFLFRPRKSCEKCRKCSHTNVSNALVTRPSTPPAQTPQRSFRGTAAGTHSARLKGSHTTAHTAKHGRFGWGWYHYPRRVPHVHKHPRAGCQNGVLCRFGVLVGDAPEERRKPSEQRCAYARRCSEGVAAPLGCVICLQLGDVAVFSLCAQYFLNVQGEGWYHYPRRALRVAETPGPRLSKGVIYRFLAWTGS